MIHFDIDERYQDDQTVGSAMSRREGVLVSVAVHGFALVAATFLPQFAFLQQLFPEPQPIVAQVVREVVEEEPRFVFVQPRIDTPAPEPPPVAELSDLDREAQDPEMAAPPENPLPFSLGNSSERIQEVPEEELAGGERPEPPLEPEATIASRGPLGATGLDVSRVFQSARPEGRELLDDALRNLERYVQGQTFNNPQGGADEPGAAIQFDTMGVDFGPWLRRFVAEVYRNWFVPQSAAVMRGQVVLQFNIYKDGRITDIQVVRPSAINGFNRAAYNAIFASSPLDPLPEEYPLDPAFFTVTFYYGLPLLAEGWRGVPTRTQQLGLLVLLGVLTLYVLLRVGG